MSISKITTVGLKIKNFRRGSAHRATYTFFSTRPLQQYSHKWRAFIHIPTEIYSFESKIGIKVFFSHLVSHFSTTVYFSATDMGTIFHCILVFSTPYRKSRIFSSPLKQSFPYHERKLAFLNSFKKCVSQFCKSNEILSQNSAPNYLVGFNFSGQLKATLPR